MHFRLRFCDVMLIVSVLCARDKGGDLYDRVMSFDKSFERHRKACAKWFERDG